MGKSFAGELHSSVRGAMRVTTLDCHAKNRNVAKLFIPDHFPKFMYFIFNFFGIQGAAGKLDLSG
jgi:hypothetical protein